jgi:hypothetical protein
MLVMVLVLCGFMLVFDVLRTLLSPALLCSLALVLLLAVVVFHGLAVRGCSVGFSFGDGGGCDVSQVREHGQVVALAVSHGPHYVAVAVSVRAIVQGFLNRLERGQ